MPRVHGDFDDFVTHSRHPLSCAAYALTGNRATAEDLVQETFVRVARHWTRLSRQDSDPLPYARRVLYRLWLDSVRWRKRRPETIGLDFEENAPDGADAVVEREALRTALGKLEPQQRAVLVLRYFEERTERETAGILECSPATVQSLARRALVTLREHSVAERRLQWDSKGKP